MSIVNKYYEGEELKQGIPKKAINLLQKINLIDNTENIKIVLARTSMGLFYEAIIVSDRQLVYYSKDLSKKERVGAIPLISITGVSISTTKMASRYICITVGGSKEIILTFALVQNDLSRFYNYLLGVVSKENKHDKCQSGADINVSVADELTKFKNLLDAGAITQEEYNIKKKQLLNV